MVKEISRDELMQMFSSGKKFKLLDALSKEHFEEEHVKGAISLPVNEIGEWVSKMLKIDDTIVVYCASFECQASTNAAKKLISLGFKMYNLFKLTLIKYIIAFSNYIFYINSNFNIDYKNITLS